MIDFINLIIGSILGWYGKEWIHYLLNKRRENWNEKRRLALKEEEKITLDLAAYYSKSDEVDLYECEVDSKFIKYPIFGFSYQDFSFGELRQLISQSDERTSIKVDQNLIKSRKKLGQNIWDDPLLFVKSINLSKKQVVISTVVGSYYEYLSTSGQLEEEVVASIIKGKRTVKLRDKYFANIAAVFKGEPFPSAFGVHTLLLFKLGSEWKTIVQRRSTDVATNADKIAGVPCFGVVPADNSVHDSLIRYNLLKEIYEELFDAEEVVKKHKRVEKDWFYTVDPIKKLIKLFNDDSANIHVLGLCIEAVNREVVLSIGVIVRDEAFIIDMLNKMKYNWEIDDIMVVNIFSNEVDDMLRTRETTSITAFSLNEARKLLK